MSSCLAPPPPAPPHNIQLCGSVWNINACLQPENQCYFQFLPAWVCLHVHRVTCWGWGPSQNMIFNTVPWTLCVDTLTIISHIFSIFRNFAHVTWICGVELSICTLPRCSKFFRFQSISDIGFGEYGCSALSIQKFILLKISWDFFFFFLFYKMSSAHRASIQQIKLPNSCLWFFCESGRFWPALLLFPISGSPVPYYSHWDPTFFQDDGYLRPAFPASPPSAGWRIPEIRRSVPVREAVAHLG